MTLTADDVRHRFLRWYAGAYPGRARLRVEQVARISDGWESDVYAISLAWEDAGAMLREELVLRLYQGADGAAKAEREFHGMRCLAVAGYSVPRVQALALEDSPFGQPCMTMERIAGRSMGAALEAASDEEHRRLVTQFCRLYVDLHTLDWRPFTPEPDMLDADSTIVSWLSGARGMATRLRITAFDPLFAWLDARSEMVTCARCSVVHGDFHPYNVLLRDDGTPAVIDWTSIGVSDYRFDLAWTLLLLGTFGYPDLRAQILAGYERLAGQPVEGMAYFDVAACLRRLGDFYITLTQDAGHVGMRPEAAAIMRDRLSHFRAVYALLQERTGRPLPAIERLLTP